VPGDQCQHETLHSESFSQSGFDHVSLHENLACLDGLDGILFSSELCDSGDEYIEHMIDSLKRRNYLQTAAGRSKQATAPFTLTNGRLQPHADAT